MHRYLKLKLSTILAICLFILLSLIYSSTAQTSGLKSGDMLRQNTMISPNLNFEKPNLLFNGHKDTIMITKSTVFQDECTYEARFYIPKYASNKELMGYIFSEVTDGSEYKLLYVYPGGIVTDNIDLRLAAQVKLDRDRWHHLAFVQGGGEARLYFDGQLLITRFIPIDLRIGNGNRSGYVGAAKWNTLSFLGNLDSLRLSNIVRYRGDKFDPPTGKMQPDEHTVLLYNFELEDYFLGTRYLWIKDLSGSDRHGILGTGIDDATAPTIVIPESLKSSLPPLGEITQNNDVFFWNIVGSLLGILAMGSLVFFLVQCKW